MSACSLREILAKRLPLHWVRDAHLDNIAQARAFMLCWAIGFPPSRLTRYSVVLGATTCTYNPALEQSEVGEDFPVLKNPMHLTVVLPYIIRVVMASGLLAVAF